MPILGTAGAASAKGFGLTNGRAPTFYVAVAHNTSPYLSIYPWTSALGFGSKVSNPSSLPTGNGVCVAFSPAGTEVFIGTDSSPYNASYSWSKSGFGSALSTPLLGGQVNAVVFNPTGTVIFLSIGATIYAYNWSSSGFGALITSTTPSGSPNSLAISPTGDAVSASYSGSPYIDTFPWSGSAFGSKYTLSSNPGSNGTSVSFSPNNNALAVGASTSGNGIVTYGWSSGYGTKYTASFSNPILTFDKTGNYLFYGSNFISSAGAIPWTGSGFGTQVNISSFGYVTTAVAVSPNNNFVVFAVSASPYLQLYPWTGSAWGTVSSNPSTLPTGTARGVAVMKF